MTCVNSSIDSVNLSISNLFFSTFKIKHLFPVPERLRTRVVYKFSCCNACCVGETSRNFSTCVREHLYSDRSSHIFKHLQNSESCRASCSTLVCFKILDHAVTKFQVKLKESMYIKLEKLDLNQQVKHINLTLSL